MVVGHCSPQGLALLGVKFSVLTGKGAPFALEPVTSALIGEAVNVPMSRNP